MAYNTSKNIPAAVKNGTPRVYTSSGASSGDGVPADFFICPNVPAGTYRYELCFLLTQAIDETVISIIGASPANETSVYQYVVTGSDLQQSSTNWSDFQLSYSNFTKPQTVKGLLTVATTGTVTIQLLGYAAVFGPTDYSIIGPNAYFVLTPVLT